MDHSTASPANWHAWLEANAPRFLLFARSQARCEADAQDLLQQVLVEAWKRHPGRTPEDALVFRALRSRAIDLGRRIDRRELREQAAPDWWQAPDGQEARDAQLEQAVNALPPHLREVVLLKVWGDLTFRQIAGVLGVPQATAASRYRYAIDRLRDELKESLP